ncbi:hypothetical protein F442_06818 [Phytophthora nicotianae P10297]|uniref:Uncharacterized protein n=3 Tax=Phytophthora nicotianae TaxID=4792 RepID=V9FCZ8_PHYNI|nr:hypothetical protein F443_06780 [Phytophthora nicotianae P1569]ETK89219.1 hypothetical protein L915_06654 [Phytophthora nicotianae]ETP47044.1 hypothetical protein F442_06818 [Phytophthora nicotianae P10297]ETL42630.1 hypothetical protein L916_06592 [Phytophthora nicotianae]ETL95801.1 hypothetical protein L917_06463 [Phytophthora nicotianae]
MALHHGLHACIAKQFASLLREGRGQSRKLCSNLELPWDQKCSSLCHGCP